MLSGVWQWQERRRGEQARLEQIARYVELGRNELEADQPARAATYLGAAYQLGDHSVGVRYPLAKAMLGVDPLIRVFRHSDTTEGNWTFAAMSPDGGRVITGSNDRNQAIVWDARTGQQLLSLDHGAWVGWVGYRPDGRVIFTSGEKSVDARLRGGARLQTVPAEGGFERLRFSRGGNQPLTSLSLNSIL